MCECCGGPTTHTEVYSVKGMTCHHCVMRVEKAVKSLPGVKDAKADLNTGKLTVTSSQKLSRDDIAKAVEEAGYELA